LRAGEPGAEAFASARVPTAGRAGERGSQMGAGAERAEEGGGGGGAGSTADPAMKLALRGDSFHREFHRVSWPWPW
jgi:hypothetical protein